MQIKNFKTLFSVHFLFLAICLTLFFTIPFEIKLRWGLGHIAVWITFLSALVLIFNIPPVIRFRKAIKAYLITFWCLPLVAACCCGFYIMFFPAIFVEMFIPPRILAQNEQYLLRRPNVAIRAQGDVLYAKEGFLLHPIGETAFLKEWPSESSYGRCESPDSAKLLSFEVLQDTAMWLVYPDTVLYCKIF